MRRQSHLEFCKNCGSEFLTTPKLKRYCSETCRKEMRGYQRKIYLQQRKETDRTKDKHLNNIRRRSTTKLANNKGKPYSEVELDKILAKNRRRKWKYSSTELALEFGRSVSSIQQVRLRRKTT